jgi:hypothetical protein
MNYNTNFFLENFLIKYIIFGSGKHNKDFSNNLNYFTI